MTERESGRFKDLKPQRDHIKEREKELRGRGKRKEEGEERGEKEDEYICLVLFLPLHQFMTIDFGNFFCSQE